MPNDTRSELKISGIRSDGGMNPRHSPDLNNSPIQDGDVCAHVFTISSDSRSLNPLQTTELWDIGIQFGLYASPTLDFILPEIKRTTEALTISLL